MTGYGLGLYGLGPYGGGTGPILTIECAFATKPGSSNPSWQDITAYTIELDCVRGRVYELDQTQPGTLNLRLDNSDRRFDPVYTAGPYYPNVLPRKRIRVRADWMNVTYYLFDGYVERWPQTYEGPQYAEVQITARDAFLPLAGAAITGTFPQELTGARIARVLSAAQWATSTPVASGGYWTLGTSALGVNNKLGYGVPTTLLDAGQKQVQGVTYAMTDDKRALAHIQEVADSEAGTVFVDGQGRLVFHDLNHRIRTQTSSVTLTDNLGAIDATHIGYGNIVTSFDFDRGANDVTVTNTGGTAQNASDGVSIDDYFRTTLPRSAQLVTDAEAANLARFLLRQLKDARDSNGNPRLRVDSVTVEPWAGDQWTAVLAREISDRVTVVRNPGVHPASVVEAINMDCYIESVRHRGSDRVWETTFQLSPASPAADFWVLGTSALGRSNVLAW